MKIYILHLYSDLLNLYGEYGNVVVLKKYLENQGVDVIVEKKTIGDEIDFEKYHFIYLGCGTESSLDVALHDLKRYQITINSVIENNVVILATGNSFEMFGKTIDGKEALGVFDYEVMRLPDRVTSDVIYTYLGTLPSDVPSIKIVGFVNKMTEIYHNFSPLFKVEFGIGENKRNDYEGVHYFNFYGTHVSGPILVKNPEFLKVLVNSGKLRDIY